MDPLDTHSLSRSLSLAHTDTHSLYLSFTHTHTHSLSLTQRKTHTLSFSLTHTDSLARSLSLSLTHTHTHTHTLTRTHSLHSVQVIEELKTVTFKELQAWTKMIWTEGFGEALVQVPHQSLSGGTCSLLTYSPRT